MKRHAQYRRTAGGQPQFHVGEVRKLLAEHDYLFSLYDADVSLADGTRWRHLLTVPVSVSAVSFTVGIALFEEDSRQVDAGDLEDIASLAQAIQYDYRSYRVFPANELGRSCCDHTASTPMNARRRCAS